MSDDNNLKERLLDNKNNDNNERNDDNETFSVNYFVDLFGNQNINEGYSTEKLKEDGGKDAIIKALKTDAKNGLEIEKNDNKNNNKDLAWRINKYGTNEKGKSKDNSFFDFVLATLKDPMLQILIAASIVSTVIGILQEGLTSGWIEGFSIFLAVLIVVSISSFQNYEKDQQFKKLDEENSKKDIKVKRNGHEIVEIPIEQLVVGDILHLSIGDIVPGDGILLKDRVTMDESAMTGESDLKKKTAKEEDFDDKVNPFIISGTEVMDGSGLMLVVAVGSNKVAGRNADLMKIESGDTPLQEQLTSVADKIGELGLMAAIFIGIVLVVKDIVNQYQSGNSIFGTYLLDSLVSAFIICITVIVVAIPEGLPMAVTISLAYSVSKMKDEHNLVKQLEASETMGNVNNVCTDKTGTLTKGVMEVRQFFIENKNYETDGNINEEANEILVQSISNNITAYAEKEDGKLKAKGNPTEAALLNFLIDRKEDYEKSKEEPVRQLPFSSEYKFMSTIIKLKDSDKYRLFIKGAPERVLEYACKIRLENGKEEDIESYKEELNKQQDKYAEQALRTILVGYKDFSADQSDLENTKKENLEFFKENFNDLVLLAMFGIADSPRDDVHQAIKQCHKAGITVRMVTGDNIKTAIAISKDVGIITTEEANEAFDNLKSKNNKESKDEVNKKNTFKSVKHANDRPIALEGNQFRELSGGYNKIEEGKDEKGNPKYKYELASVEKFTKTTANLKVIARASPDDKFLLVLGLKQLNNIVAVTGDGTNDAPALKKADVGFAMGIRGTDIAKNASDIVLLNDSFSSIVTATKYGRNVYDCIRKFLQFQLTCNVVAVFMTLLGGVILNDSPLNSIQMLWVNLIMDSFASLALATEPPNEKLLDRKPYPKNVSIITSSMKINIGAQSAFQIIVLTIIIFYGDVMFNVPDDRTLSHFTWNDKVGYHFTIFFNIFVFLQVFNSINARKLQKSEINVFANIFNNWLYLFIQLVIVAGQVLMVTFGGRAIRTHALTINQHLGCIGIASLSLVVGLLVKLLPIGYDEDHSNNKAKNKFSIAKSIRGKTIDIYGIKNAKSIKDK